MVSVRLMHHWEVTEVAALIRKTYDQFVASDYPEEGNNTFYQYIEEDMLRARLDSTNHFAYVAEENDRILGVIEMRNNNHCSLLFVDSESHSNGIARKLFGEALSRCLEKVPELKEISVHASPYAVMAYERLGFAKNGQEQMESGIIYQPMVLELD